MSNKIIKQNIKYYDTEATVYDENRYSSIEGKRIDRFQKQLLANYLKELPENAQLLELGCGTGRFLPYLSQIGYQLTGIDISKGMLKKARERIEAEAVQPITLLHNETSTLPFAKAEFDAVYSILVINLIQDYQQIFYDISRILKPGGLFIFSVPNLSSIFFPAGMYVNLRGKTISSNKSGYRYSHWFSRSELKTSLHIASFSIESILGQPPNVRSRNGVPPLTSSLSRWLFSKSVYIKARRYV